MITISYGLFMVLSPGDKYGCVVMSDPVVWYGVTIAAPVLDGFLPLTEAV